MTQAERAEAMFGGQGAFWPAEEASLARAEAKKTLAGRFVVPPFTVLDARQGYWRARKRQWLALGIASELGRADGGIASANQWDTKKYNYSRIATSPNAVASDVYKKKSKREEALGRALTYAEFMADPGEEAMPMTSVFDPVLCEIAYRWFSAPGASIIDPFAGGSVRGVVAAVLGRSYTGIDLRPEQVAANREQWSAISTNTDDEPAPLWLTGDSNLVLGTIEREVYDLAFSCPPYFDLEVYSNDPADLSNAADYAAFTAAHAAIIKRTVDALRPDRFAVWVVGNVRDKRGMTLDLMGDTVRAFGTAGARLYNEAVLVTAVGTLRLRVVRAFSSGRKLGKHHQQLLVFVKGDPKRAAQACGEIELLPGADAEPGAQEEALDERW